MLLQNTSQLSVPRSKVSIYRDGPSSVGKNQLCVIQLIIVQFLYPPRFLIIHKRYNRRTGKRIIYTPNGDITECDVLFWSQVIMQDSGITCFKWVNAALWSVVEDALLNHVQEHQASCVNSGCDVTQLVLRCETSCCWYFTMLFNGIYWWCAIMYADVSVYLQNVTLFYPFQKDKHFASL